MKLCKIYRITGEYAVLFVVSSSYWRVKAWLISRGEIGHPWTEHDELCGVNVDDLTKDQYDSIEFDITEVMTVMADIGDEPVEIGGMQ